MQTAQNACCRTSAENVLLLNLPCWLVSLAEGKNTMAVMTSEMETCNMTLLDFSPRRNGNDDGGEVVWFVLAQETLTPDSQSSSLQKRRQLNMQNSSQPSGPLELK